MSLQQLIFDEKVYEKNIFHLLGLRTNASQREIRRRKEELEIANMMGGETWNNAFSHLLGSRNVPTWQEIEDAFERLNDTEERAIAEFFWFGELDKNDCAITEIMQGSSAKAREIWEHNGTLVAKHNLAVFWHFYAIENELKTSDDVNRNENWKNAYKFWEELIESDIFWATFKQRVDSSGSLPLTSGFFHRLRKGFPKAFCIISANFAVKHAEKGREADVKRNLNYIKNTYFDIDDPYEPIKQAVEKLQTKAEEIALKYANENKSNPQDGIKHAEALLKETEDLRRTISIFASTGAEKVYVDVCTRIAGVCNNCALAYKTATNDTRSTIRILNILIQMKIDPGLMNIIQSNLVRLKSVQSENQETRRKFGCFLGVLAIVIIIILCNVSPSDNNSNNLETQIPEVERTQKNYKHVYKESNNFKAQTKVTNKKNYERVHFFPDEDGRCLYIRDSWLEKFKREHPNVEECLLFIDDKGEKLMVNVRDLFVYRKERGFGPQQVYAFYDEATDKSVVVKEQEINTFREQDMTSAARTKVDEIIRNRDIEKQKFWKWFWRSGQ